MRRTLLVLSLVVAGPAAAQTGVAGQEAESLNRSVQQRLTAVDQANEAAKAAFDVAQRRYAEERAAYEAASRANAAQVAEAAANRRSWEAEMRRYEARADGARGTAATDPAARPTAGATAPGRRVCAPVTATGTRLRAQKVCRTVGQAGAIPRASPPPTVGARSPAS